MPDPSLLMTLAGISSVLGLLGILAYFYFIVQARSLERSVRETVEGEGLFNADQILAILKELKTDDKRLEALVHLKDLDKEKAEAVLSKVGGRINIEKLQETSQGHSRRVAGIAGSFFLAIGLFGLLSTPGPEVVHPPEPLSPTDSVVLTQYPRVLNLEWAPVEEAVGYLVNVEIQDPDSSEWHPHPFGYGEKATSEPFLAMEFVGSQPGRWRVAARTRSGEAGEPSRWSYFEFRDDPQAQEQESEGATEGVSPVHESEADSAADREEAVPEAESERQEESSEDKKYITGADGQRIELVLVTGNHTALPGLSIEPYYISTQPLRYGQLKSYCRTHACSSPISSDLDEPIEEISFQDAVGLTRMLGGRVPNPVEWANAYHAGLIKPASDLKLVRYTDVELADVSVERERPNTRISFELAFFVVPRGPILPKGTIRLVTDRD